MSFKNKDMSVIAYANGFTLWHYKTNEDTVKQLIDNSKYFAKLYTLINSGDIIIANLKDETAFLVVDSVGDESVKLRRM